MTKMLACLSLAVALLAPAARAAPATTLDGDLDALLGRLGEARPEATPWLRGKVLHHLERLAAQKNLGALLARKQQRWPTIARELAARGLPEELGYLAWAESGFDGSLSSPLGSRGVWQFIPATARRYGLTVTAESDERLDFAKETHAATEYLIKLFGEFGKGSPLLALAAYNAGETAVHKALDASPAHRDFAWLAEQKRLPEEATEYVPTILAAALLGEHGERYGLK